MKLDKLHVVCKVVVLILTYGTFDNTKDLKQSVKNSLNLFNNKI